MRKEIDDILRDSSPEKDSLIPLLQKTQEKFGYLPEKAMVKIANYLDISPTKVWGVATFYSQFRFEPQGDHSIKVCHGTSCHVKGAEEITETIEDELGIEPGGTTQDEKFSLERVACLGCCSLAPVIMIDDTVYGNLTRQKVKEILHEYGEEDE